MRRGLSKAASVSNTRSAFASRRSLYENPSPSQNLSPNPSASIDDDEELQQLLQDIRRIGIEGDARVTFRELYSDAAVEKFYEALVGILLKAKKRGLIAFSGQMLLRGPHDNVIISIMPTAFASPNSAKKKKLDMGTNRVSVSSRASAFGGSGHGRRSSLRQFGRGASTSAINTTMPTPPWLDKENSNQGVSKAAAEAAETIRQQEAAKASPDPSPTPAPPTSPPAESPVSGVEEKGESPAPAAVPAAVPAATPADEEGDVEIDDNEDDVEIEEADDVDIESEPETEPESKSEPEPPSTPTPEPTPKAEAENATPAEKRTSSGSESAAITSVINESVLSLTSDAVYSEDLPPDDPSQGEMKLNDIDPPSTPENNIPDDEEEVPHDEEPRGKFFYKSPKRDRELGGRAGFLAAIPALKKKHSSDEEDIMDEDAEKSRQAAAADANAPEIESSAHDKKVPADTPAPDTDTPAPANIPNDSTHEPPLERSESGESLEQDEIFSKPPSNSDVSFMSPNSSQGKLGMSLRMRLKEYGALRKSIAKKESNSSNLDGRSPRKADGSVHSAVPAQLASTLSVDLPDDDGDEDVKAPSPSAESGATDTTPKNDNTQASVQAADEEAATSIPPNSTSSSKVEPAAPVPTDEADDMDDSMHDDDAALDSKRGEEDADIHPKLVANPSDEAELETDEPLSTAPVDDDDEEEILDDIAEESLTSNDRGMVPKASPSPAASDANNDQVSEDSFVELADEDIGSETDRQERRPGGGVESTTTFDEIISYDEVEEELVESADEVPVTTTDDEEIIEVTLHEHEVNSAVESQDRFEPSVEEVVYDSLLEDESNPVETEVIDDDGDDNEEDEEVTLIEDDEPQEEEGEDEELLEEEDLENEEEFQEEEIETTVVTESERNKASERGDRGVGTILPVAAAATEQSSREVAENPDKDNEQFNDTFEDLRQDGRQQTLRTLVVETVKEDKKDGKKDDSERSIPSDISLSQFKPISKLDLASESSFDGDKEATAAATDAALISSPTDGRDDDGMAGMAPLPGVEYTSGSSHSRNSWMPPPGDMEVGSEELEQLQRKDTSWSSNKDKVSRVDFAGYVQPDTSSFKWMPPEEPLDGDQSPVYDSATDFTDADGSAMPPLSPVTTISNPASVGHIPSSNRKLEDVMEGDEEETETEEEKTDHTSGIPDVPPVDMLDLVEASTENLGFADPSENSGSNESGAAGATFSAAPNESSTAPLDSGNNSSSNVGGADGIRIRGDNGDDGIRVVGEGSDTDADGSGAMVDVELGDGAAGNGNGGAMGAKSRGIGLGDDEDDDEKEEEEEEKKRGFFVLSACCCGLLIGAAIALAIYILFIEDDDSSPAIRALVTEPPTQTPSVVVLDTAAPTAAVVTASPIVTPLLTSPPTAQPTVGTVAPTGSPTIAPTLSADNAATIAGLISFIDDVFPEGAPALADTSSPQYQALLFIFNRIPNNQGIFDDFRFLQRYALATVYYSTGGTEWNNSTDWLTSANECDWYTSSPAATICDGGNNVVELDLSNNNLRGTMPIEIAMLADSLEVIRMSGNRLVGTIPDIVVESNINLVEFSVSGNLLRGPIPATVGQLQNLAILDLSRNGLNETIPSEIGSLGSLVNFSIAENDITGAIPPELASNIAIQNLFIDRTTLTSGLPPTLCDNLVNIQQFWSDCTEIGGCECCTTCCEGDVCLPT